jgi:homoaconitate hydratase family protein
MKPQSISHKILAEKSGRSYVESGDHIVAEIDLCFAHDPVIGVLTQRFFEAFGQGSKVWDPSKIALFQDHLVPAKNKESKALLQLMDRFVQEQGIQHYFPYGKNFGVCHIILIEQGLTRPGEILIGTDSHTVTAGAFSEFATGVGVFDMVSVFKSGQLWFTVPKVIRVNVEGELPSGVMAKDLILKLVGDLGLDGASGCTIEWTGTTIEQMSLEERATLCNMSVEAGATNGIMTLNKETRDFLRARGVSNYKEYQTDSDFEYARQIHYSAEDLQPMIALPHRPDNTLPISQVKSQKIPTHQVYVGSCTGGKMHDIETFCQLTKGKAFHHQTSVIVVPATMSIYKEMLSKGLIDQLLESGAVVESPGCKACYGVHGGVTGDNENCLATINRNFRGRMGNPKSFVYLSSPIVAAHSAMAGYITDGVSQ